MKDVQVQNKVKEYMVEAREPVTVWAIESALNFSRKQIKKALQALRSSGAVLRTSKQYDKWVSRKTFFLET